MEFFPRNITTFFPNIQYLTFTGNAITDININDLIPLRNLRMLDLAMNKITSLDSNLLSLFVNNKMTFIRFSSNNITCVGHDFILPSADTVDFRLNPCINQQAVNPTQLANLRSNLRANCLPDNCPSEVNPPEDAPPEESPPENCPTDCQSITSLLELVKNNGNMLQDLINRQLQLEAAFLEFTGNQNKIEEIFKEN